MWLFQWLRAGDKKWRSEEGTEETMAVAVALVDVFMVIVISPREYCFECGYGCDRGVDCGSGYGSDYE